MVLEANLTRKLATKRATSRLGCRPAREDSGRPLRYCATLRSVSTKDMNLPLEEPSLLCTASRMKRKMKSANRKGATSFRRKDPVRSGSSAMTPATVRLA